ncbi:MAG: PepSY domain-containing protein [Wenzhouxiangella sp.]
MYRLLRKLLIALSLAATLVVSAWAVSLEEAAERVARQYDAKVVSAHTVERDGRRIHVIRILTREGVVRTVRVPADEG